MRQHLGEAREDDAMVQAVRVTMSLIFISSGSRSHSAPHPIAANHALMGGLGLGVKKARTKSKGQYDV